MPALVKHCAERPWLLSATGWNRATRGPAVEEVNLDYVLVYWPLVAIAHGFIQCDPQARNTSVFLSARKMPT